MSVPSKFLPSSFPELVQGLTFVEPERLGNPNSKEFLTNDYYIIPFNDFLFSVLGSTHTLSIFTLSLSKVSFSDRLRNDSFGSFCPFFYGKTETNCVESREKHWAQNMTMNFLTLRGFCYGKTEKTM